MTTDAVSRSTIQEILAKVRRLEISTRRLVDGALAGQYHSVFRGQGMNFEDVRRYQAGDDVRSIDWNVTARTGEPHIKLFTEERELTIMILLDVSASGIFGSRTSSKREVAAELAAVLAMSAVKNGDKVGTLLFSDQTELYLPPKKGRNHALRLIREMLYFVPARRGTNIELALEHLVQVLPRRAVVFLVSDFQAPNFSKVFGVVASKHDLIAVRITDAAELELPDVGWVVLEDSESGTQQVLNTSDAATRRRVAATVAAQRSAFEQLARRHRVDLIDVQTGQDVVKPLVAFFKARAKKAGVR